MFWMCSNRYVKEKTKWNEILHVNIIVVTLLTHMSSTLVFLRCLEVLWQWKRTYWTLGWLLLRCDNGTRGTCTQPIPSSPHVTRWTQNTTLPGNLPHRVHRKICGSLRNGSSRYWNPLDTICIREIIMRLRYKWYF